MERYSVLTSVPSWLYVVRMSMTVQRRGCLPLVRHCVPIVMAISFGCVVVLSFVIVVSFFVGSSRLERRVNGAQVY